MKPVILEGNFRVWFRNQTSDYRVSLGLDSLLLRPLQSNRSRNSNNCCRLCSQQACIEILGRDIVSCRPAHSMSLNTRFNMGPPLFMLVAYPIWSTKSNARFALYFHWTPRIGSSAHSDDNIDEEEEDLLSEVMRVKEEWVRAIHDVFFPWRVPTFHTKGFLSQKLLVVLNPVAGNSGALRVFKDRLVPLFKDAGQEYELLVTEHANHAYDVVRAENLARWRAVVVVAGDGTVGDVFNGLFDRPDWQDALAHLAVCAVPAGSGGGRHAFARSMCHAQGEAFDGEGGVMSALMNAARCRIGALDLMFVQMKGCSRVGVGSVGWGAISEMRPGSSTSGSRLIKIPIKRLMQLTSVKTRGAVLSFLPVERRKRSVVRVPVNFGSPSVSSEERSSSSTEIKKSNSKSESSSSSSYTCSTCSFRDNHNAKESSSLHPKPFEASMEALIPKFVPSLPVTSSAAKVAQPAPTRYTYTSLLTEGQLYFRSWQELDVRLRHTGPFPLLNNHPALMKPSLSHQPQKVQKRPKPYFPAMPDLPKPLPKDAGWRTEIGDYVSVHLLNQAFIDQNRILAPESLPDDGLLWLLVVRAGISRRDLFRLLSSIESGGEKSLPDPMPRGAELIPVRGMRLAPLTKDGLISVDGEVVECDCVQVFVMPEVARTLVK